MRKSVFSTLALLLGFALAGKCALAGLAEKANQIHQAAGVRGGLIVHVGCGDGRLTAALRTHKAFVVHGLDPDPGRVAQARAHLADLGLSGPVSIHPWRGPLLPYADNLVNLLLIEVGMTVAEQEIQRVLAPNGIAITPDLQQEIKKPNWLKPWPDDLDEWGHFLHGPDNNAVARDQRVGPSERIQWVAGPRWSRDHDVTPSVFAPVSAQGRLFYILEQGPLCIIDERLPETYALVARDAFNGIPLWERPLESWYSSRVIWGHIPVHTQRRLVAQGGHLYVTLGLDSPVSVLDAATGETIRVCAGTAATSEIVVDGGVLVCVIRHEQPAGGLLAGRERRRFRQGYTGPERGAEALAGLDAVTGKALWKTDRPCLPLTLAMSAGKVFFAEEERVVCLDARSGAELWTAPCPARSLLVHEGIVAVATDRRTAAYQKAPKTIEVLAFDASNGKTLWSTSGDCLPNFVFFYHPVDLYVARGMLWGLADQLEWNEKPGSGALLGLDLRTGETRARISLEGAFTAGHHVRCYRGKATENFLLFNKRGIEFIDIATGEPAVQQHWTRGACRYGILPCNGLIYAPSHACACYPGAMLEGFVALSSGERIAKTAIPQEAANSREIAPAVPVSGAVPPPPHAGDWPVYRHDNRRTSTSATPVPPGVRPVWQADIGGKLTAPVAAEGQVYVAAADAHTLHCLSADNGRELWRFTAGGRIDSPPVIYGGNVLFGGRDGRAYCLDAKTGSLIWRFRPAPGERWIGACGQLESAWPLHGSLLVQNGLAYLAAGRSSFVDGGIHVCAVDALSGEEKFRTTLSGPDPNDAAVPKTASRIPGAVPDILIGDGKSVFMRHLRLPADLAGPLTPESFAWEAKSQNQIVAGSGFLDDTLFNRTIWQYGPRIDRSQMLAVDGNQVYGLRVYSGISWNCPIYKVGEGHLIFRQDIGKPVPKPPPGEARMDLRIPSERYAWHRRVPARVSAMVLAGARRRDPGEKCLFVAGAPDVIEADDPLGAFEGRKGGLLITLAGETGELLDEQSLSAPPVWDGLIACRRRLYASLQNGSLVCLGKE